MKQIFSHYNEIIPEFPLFMESIRRPLPIHIRVNQLKPFSASIENNLRGKGYLLTKSMEKCDNLFYAEGPSSPGKLLEYFLGHIHPQALTSCLASMALNPHKETFVLDMCASPGGKTAHMSQLMNNTGLIVANELSPGRHISLGNTLDRLGVLNSITTSYQAQQFPLKKQFDFILADVPCSGEGTLREKENDNYRPVEGKSRRYLSALQKKIIIRAFDLLKKGGKMLYSTCTYCPDENEEVVNYLLKNRDAEILPIDLEIDHEPGILEWKGREYDPRIVRSARFYPHRVDSVGFFMAKIGRV
jgi:NOL1/NOP2/sun family putative RNA methylase